MSKTHEMIEINEATVLAAMSVVPIIDLCAEDIVGEMFVVGDGRLIIPILKRLLAKGLITRLGKYRGRYFYRLSDDMAQKVVRKFNRRPNPFGIPPSALKSRYNAK